MNITEYLLQCSFKKNGIAIPKTCNRTQVVPSEIGNCLTFNNINISANVLGAPAKVPGVGKGNGFELELNPQPHGQPVQYRVFISEIGTTISQVYFDVKPSMNHDYFFDLHGLHYVQAGPGFKEWNQNRGVCYFPDQKELKHFSAYMQANCRLECSWNRTISKCGCSPQWLNIQDALACNSTQMECWKESLDQENSKDKAEIDTECDCKNDCEMTHFFYSMRKVEKETTDKNSSKMFFYFDTHIITQINIQLRLSFFDKIASIGGTLGLFSGISVISVVEILFYISLLLTAFFNKTLKQPMNHPVHKAKPMKNFLVPTNTTTIAVTEQQKVQQDPTTTIPRYQYYE